MHKKQKAEAALLHQKLLPLYYHDSADTSVAVLKALYAGGIRILEYTARGEAALKNFSVLRSTVNDSIPGLQLGIGTIKTKAQAEAFLAAGADFIVCPSIDEEVGRTVEKAGLLWIPGCMTPTEIARAENAGARIVKIFPGNLLGPSYITAIRDLFPGLRFVVTGGVEAEAENLRGWFGAGVVGVGMGSKVITKEAIERNDFDSIKQTVQKALQMVQGV